MRWHTHRPFLRRIATGLMLLAALAFVQQGTLIGASQAAALGGSMPEPAVVLDGAIHYHDNLARHVHMHGGNNGPGHVHHAAHHDDDDDVDDTSQPLLWSLGCPSAVIPVGESCAGFFKIVSALAAEPQDHRAGVEPDGLTRPPSTPSIA